MSFSQVMETVRVARLRTEPLTWTLLWKGGAADLTAMGISTVVFYLLSVSFWLPEEVDLPSLIAYIQNADYTVDGASCTVVNATVGDISWAPGANDLATPGFYYYQFKATDSGGKVTPWPDGVGRFQVLNSIVRV